jgi:cold shock CspA family protein
MPRREAPGAGRMEEGRVRRFNGVYGFIVGDDSTDIYFPANAMLSASDRAILKPGHVVAFERITTGPGKFRARVVRLLP